MKKNQNFVNLATTYKNIKFPEQRNDIQQCLPIKF